MERKPLWRPLFGRLFLIIAAIASVTGCGVQVRKLAVFQADVLTAGLSIVSGNLQSTQANQPFSAPLRVRAMGVDGLPLSGVSISFHGERGGSSASSAISVTDASGYATADILAGAREPEQDVVARPLEGILPDSGETASVRFSLSAVATGTGNFVAQVPQAVAASPYHIATADIDGDGKLDLATPHNTLDQVHVFLGNGDGTFGAATIYATGDQPYSVTFDDLNGDGRPDMVVPNRGSDTVSVFLASGAAGNFAAKVDYGVGDEPYAATIADFNSDGRPDMAVSNRASGDASLLLAASLGTFQPAVSMPTGTGSRSIRAGDLNSDGRPDIVVGNWDDNNISVFLSSGAPGSFAARVNYAVGTWPRGISLADFDGDGNLDVAVANYNSNSVGVLLNTSGTPGILGAHTQYAAAAQNHTIETADVNGDGRPDILLGHANANGTHVFVNSAATPGTFAAGVVHATGSPFGIAVGDFNLDGTIDFAHADPGAAQIRVHLNP